MAVYYKFQSEKKYNSICVDSPFVTVAYLKDKIFQSRYGNRGTDLGIEISNSRTNEVYHDETMLIPKCTTVLVRRTPKHHRSRFIAHLNELKVDAIDDVSSVTDDEPLKLDDEFGPEIYAPLAQPTPLQASNAVLSDGDYSTPAFYLKCKADGPGRGGTMIRGHGSGLAGFGWNKPPQGYVCHRCNEPGHFIQHCPTNGDPDYNIRSYSSPSGGVAAVKPDTNEIERMSTTSSQGDLPPELNCPLCKEVMKDAVLTRKCCFNSIRDYVVSRSMCVCGAKYMLADDLIPNKTLRDTINRILESSSGSSSGNYGCSSQHQDKELSSKGANALPKYPVKETPKPADEEELQKKETATAVKKQKKAQLPVTGIHMQSRDSFMMPMSPSTYKCDPYWTGNLSGMDAYMGLFGSRMPFEARYGSRLMDLPVPFAVPNAPPFHMVQPQREIPKDHDHGREEIISSMTMDVPSTKPKYNAAPLSNKRKPERHHSPSTERKSDMKKHTKYESSDDDDDRHFKRKRSWYGPSPASTQEKDCKQRRMVQA
ncbi:hypothetical protein V2J09_000195 [Rumex salicifolius]